MPLEVFFFLKSGAVALLHERMSASQLCAGTKTHPPGKLQGNTPQHR